MYQNDFGPEEETDNFCIECLSIKRFVRTVLPYELDTDSEEKRQIETLEIWSWG